MREEGKRRQEPQLGPRMALAASPPRIGDNRITRKFWHRKRPASLLPLDCDSCNARQGGRDKAHITQEEVPKGSPFYAFIIRAEKPSLMTDLELDCGGTQPHGKWDNRQNRVTPPITCGSRCHYYTSCTKRVQMDGGVCFMMARLTRRRYMKSTLRSDMNNAA